MAAKKKSRRTLPGAAAKQKRAPRAAKTKTVKQPPPASRARPAAANGHEVQHAVEQFLYRQADLLDAKR
jgi:hypothetical protein